MDWTHYRITEPKRNILGNIPEIIYERIEPAIYNVGVLIWKTITPILTVVLMMIAFMSMITISCMILSRLFGKEVLFVLISVAILLGIFYIIIKVGLIIVRYTTRKSELKNISSENVLCDCCHGWGIIRYGRWGYEAGTPSAPNSGGLHYKVTHYNICCECKGSGMLLKKDKADDRIVKLTFLPPVV